jgi:hypothetical protein
MASERWLQEGRQFEMYIAQIGRGMWNAVTWFSINCSSEFSYIS